MSILKETRHAHQAAATSGKTQILSQYGIAQLTQIRSYVSKLNKSAAFDKKVYASLDEAGILFLSAAPKVNRVAARLAAMHQFSNVTFATSDLRHIQTVAESLNSKGTDGKYWQITENGQGDPVAFCYPIAFVAASQSLCQGNGVDFAAIDAISAILHEYGPNGPIKNGPILNENII